MLRLSGGARWGEAIQSTTGQRNAMLTFFSRSEIPFGPRTRTFSSSRCQTTCEPYWRAWNTKPIREMPVPMRTRSAVFQDSDRFTIGPEQDESDLSALGLFATTVHQG